MRNVLKAGAAMLALMGCVTAHADFGLGLATGMALANSSSSSSQGAPAAPGPANGWLVLSAHKSEVALETGTPIKYCLQMKEKAWGRAAICKEWTTDVATLLKARVGSTASLVGVTPGQTDSEVYVYYWTGPRKGCAQ